MNQSVFHGMSAKGFVEHCSTGFYPPKVEVSAVITEQSVSHEAPVVRKAQRNLPVKTERNQMNKLDLNLPPTQDAQWHMSRFSSGFFTKHVIIR